MDFVLSADLDWASEDAIAHFLAIATRFDIRPTLFVTHASETVALAAARGRAELAIHPNFLPGSSHGDDIDAVVAHVLALVPGARSARCHRYADSPAIAAALARHGIVVDSNSCRHLETGIRPERQPGGCLRLPVFFEDDVHWGRGPGWDFAALAADFFAPGLKILNFHPFFVALNIPDPAFYARHKAMIPTLTRNEIAALRHQGAGTETLLVDILTAVLAAGHRFVTLGALADSLPAEGVGAGCLRAS